MEPMFVFTKMIDTVDFPPDLRPRTILRHFNALAQRTGSETESDIITIGIRAAKTSIKISRILHEVEGWGELTLTSWNMTPARYQDILAIHDTLGDLHLDQLHEQIEILVTGGETQHPPLKIINAMENIITHTVMEYLPVLWRLRLALSKWEDALQQSEEMKRVDIERRERMAERVSVARQPKPKVYKEFTNLLFNFGGARRLDPSTPVMRSRPNTAFSRDRDTPPSTPPPSLNRPSSSRSDTASQLKGEKETFFIDEMKITWEPFHESDPRYHTNAHIVIYPPKRRYKRMYVSLVTRKEKGKEENESRTTIHVRIGGGWEEFEIWFQNYLQHLGAR